MARKPIKKHIEHTDAAHNQQVEHVNEYPLDLSGLSAVKHIAKTYYNEKLPPVYTIEDLLKRTPRYEFFVYLKKVKYAEPVHHFIFDKEIDAKKAYKYYMSTMIDEKIEPYRKIVESGGTLTNSQLEECEKIQKLLPDD